MPGLITILFLGIILGMRHATDADHVVAVTTIVTRRESMAGAMRIGVLWGVGHSATILLVGGAIILLGVVIPPRLGLAMEFAVALMLIGLGAYNLLSRRDSPVAPPTARPLLIGVVHGLAGSAAIALMVLTTIPQPGWAFGYLMLFGLGTIAGMMGVTVAVATPMALTARRFDGFNRSLQYVSGTLSVVLGLVLAAQLTLVNGLFAATPAWIPQ